MTPSAATAFSMQTVPVTFNEEAHTYVHTGTGRLMPGVTTILKAAGKAWMGPWMLKEAVGYLAREWKPGETYTATARDAILSAAKSAHKRKSEEARDSGTDAHGIIEQIIRCRMAGKPLDHDLPKDAAATSSIKAFLEWEEAVHPEYLLSEQPVCSVLHWYAGKLDVVVRIKGRVGVLDVKTSKAIYPEYFAQMAAYQRALEEWTDTPIAFRAVLRTPKDGKPYEWREAPFSVETDFEYFLSCLVLSRYQQAVDTISGKGYTHA